MRMRVKMTSLLMAGILFISAFSGSAYAAETAGAEMSSEGEEVSALEEETSEESVLTEDAVEDLTISESETVKDAADAAEESPEEDAIRDEEEPVTMYTITLNANGGYFEKEWDDILREYVEKEEVVNKMIEPGEAVKAIPVMEREDAEAKFLGWSLKEDGELIPHSEEEYTPEESGVLFAVWEIEERDQEELDDGAAETAETEDFEEASVGVTDAAETEEVEEAGVGATDTIEYAEPEESGLDEVEIEDSEVSDIGATDAAEYAEPEEPGLDSVETEDSEESGIGATNETEYANPEESGIASTELIEEEVTETVNKEPELATAGNFTLTIYAAEASLISSNNGDFGHAWLSITNNMSTPYDFYGYFIEPGCSMDLGLFGDQTLGDSGIGGVFLNRESCVMREPKVDCYSVNVSIEAINKIRAAVPEESYYHDGHLSGDHVYNDNLWHNCTTFAVKMWNLAVGYFERFNYDPITVADMPSEYVTLIRERNLLRHGKLVTSTHYSNCSVGLDDVFHVNKEGDLIPTFPLYIEPEDVHVMVGESTSIEAKFRYTDARDDNVNWRSSDPSIAKVVNGQIVGYKRGTCTITASLGKYQTAQCVVKVMDGSIYTVEELKAISSNLSGSYVLMNDLDLGNEEWTPIGSASNPFTGEFDGNGHSISGLKITGKKDYQGLFGKIKNAKISRLRVYGSVGGNMYVGAIAGEAESSALSYCVNYATVVGVDQVGGVIGRCYKSSMDYCMNAQFVSGSGRCVGGIAADIYPSGSITHCLNIRMVSGGYDLTGGIAGGSTSGTVSSCVNAAAVYGGSRTGAIAGDNSSYSGSRSNNYFLRTSSVNSNFPIVGTGGGTFTSVSDSKVTDLKNAILNWSEGGKQDWPLEISLSCNKVNAGDKVTVIVKGCDTGLSFKSSDSAVATVSSKGIVTTKRVGEVKITVTAGKTTTYNTTSKSVTLDVYPKSPDKVTAENLASGIKLTWTKVSDATRYYIYRDEKLIKTIKKGSTVTFTDKTVKESGKFYTYKVTSGTEKGAVGGRQCYIYRLSRPSAPTLSKYNRYMFIECKTNEAVDGFHIQLTEDKNFEKGRTTYKAAATTVSGYITNLSAGKRYYVRVRTYVSKNGQVYCSAWSKGKSLKLGSGSSKKVTATKGKSTNASSANTSSTNASSANVRIKFSGTQTMATGTSRRIYVEGAGTRSVNVTSSSSVVRIKKDSKSYIVTANGAAGTSNVTVSVGGTKKRFHIVALSDRQIAERVWAKVKAKYKLSNLENYYRSRDNKLLYVTISTPQGDGRPWIRIKVNLSTGRADCGDMWQFFLSKISKTFLIW